MQEFDIQNVPRKIDAYSDFELPDLFHELRSLIDALKGSGEWEVAKGRADLVAVKEALKRRAISTDNETVMSGCLGLLVEAEETSDTEFIVNILARALRQVRTADRALFAAIRLAMAADQVSDEEYLRVIGVGAISAFDCEKHLRIAELVLNKRGIATTA